MDARPAFAYPVRKNAMSKSARPTIPAPKGASSAQSRDTKPRADRESATFVRTMVWVLVISGLFLAGQLVRYHFNLAQLREIQAQTKALYVSALGPDIGQSPFGRLQFEQGKLAASHRVGLDPLEVMAALSRPAVESLRLEGLSLTGMTGRARGFFGPNVSRFDEYINALSDDERYFFSLEKREDVFGGITFSLIVEPK
jgi:hypothetical protein